MKKTLLLIVAIAAIATTSAAEIANFIQVSGKGEIKVTPNEFTLSITIDESATKGKYSVEKVEANMIKALSKIGINKESLTMSGISSLAVKKRDALTKASYELKLNSMESLKECYNTFDELGITTVRLSKATNSDMEKYRSEARGAAVKDAISRAKELGEALGQDVGGCFELSDRSSYANESVFLRAASYTRSDNAIEEPEPIEFRDITITYNVDAKFILGLDSESQHMIIGETK